MLIFFRVVDQITLGVEVARVIAIKLIGLDTLNSDGIKDGMNYGVKRGNGEMSEFMKRLMQPTAFEFIGQCVSCAVRAKGSDAFPSWVASLISIR